MDEIKKKFQVDITKEEFDEVEALIKKCKAKGKKDLFFNSIAFLDWAVDEILSGRAIASIDKESENYREIVMPIFRKIKPEIEAE